MLDFVGMIQSGSMQNLGDAPVDRATLFVWIGIPENGALSSF